MYIGKISKGEIDFIVTKNGAMKYIQVFYELSDEKTRERGSLLLKKSTIIFLNILF